MITKKTRASSTVLEFVYLDRKGLYNGVGTVSRFGHWEAMTIARFWGTRKSVLVILGSGSVLSLAIVAGAVALYLTTETTGIANAHHQEHPVMFTAPGEQYPVWKSVQQAHDALNEQLGWGRWKDLENKASVEWGFWIRNAESLSTELEMAATTLVNKELRERFLRAAALIRQGTEERNVDDLRKAHRILHELDVELTGHAH